MVKKIADGDLLNLIRFEAVRLARRLPRGYDRDDLESVGNEAAVEALARYDAADPDRFRAVLRLTIRNRMKSFIAQVGGLHRKSRAKEVGFPVCAETGEPVELPDRRAADPAERAAAREGAFSLARVARRTPPPDRVAERVVALREAMFAAVSAGDVAEVMAGLVRDAKAGDAKARKLLLDYLQPGRSGVTVQQAVVVNAADVT
jgi:hypothetical protein